MRRPGVAWEGPRCGVGGTLGVGGALVGCGVGGALGVGGAVVWEGVFHGAPATR